MSLERVVAELADTMKWNWTRGTTHRDAADSVLYLMAREGLIEYAQHPSGGAIWRTNGKLFGRTDGMTDELFNEMRKAR